ncbi:MAG: hypothetical protein H6508_00055 [Calditrichaeota bacterium]|nr:hypothetical protein [Calditrichota bacterium]MCB9365564.1 hypothetical protein [Calditrichota bacterium]
MGRTRNSAPLIKVSDFEYSLQMREAVHQFKQAYLKKALKQHGGNISQTARAIGVSRRTLQLQIKRCETSQEQSGI